MDIFSEKSSKQLFGYDIPLQLSTWQKSIYIRYLPPNYKSMSCLVISLLLQARQPFTPVGGKAISIQNNTLFRKR